MIWCALAFASDPLPLAAPTGLVAPVVSRAAPGWRAGLEDGWVRHAWYADEDAAREAFAFQRIAAAAVPLPDATIDGADEAAGDPGGFLVIRQRNRIFVVKSPRARVVARGLLAP